MGERKATSTVRRAEAGFQCREYPGHAPYAVGDGGPETEHARGEGVQVDRIAVADDRRVAASDVGGTGPSSDSPSTASGAARRAPDGPGLRLRYVLTDSHTASSPAAAQVWTSKAVPAAWALRSPARTRRPRRTTRGARSTATSAGTNSTAGSAPAGCRPDLDQPPLAPFIRGPEIGRDDRGRPVEPPDFGRGRSAVRHRSGPRQQLAGGAGGEPLERIRHGSLSTHE